MADRVVVGMSGGVDSAVAAALLVDAGYEVIGCTLLVWSPPGVDMAYSDSCCGVQAAEDARRVAARLGIRHYVLDVRDIFYRKVVTDYVEQYGRGCTPNPCVLCNEWIKFDAMLERARALGADLVATGHYARREWDVERSCWHLLRGIDPHKDQSYALYRLSQEQLAVTLFPLGELTKAETRAIAAERGLPVAGKPDSQETCFVPNNDPAALIRLLAPETDRPGNILTSHGARLGRHPGTAFFTIGQRKGLGALGRPYYVSRIDPASAELTVCTENDPELYSTTVHASSCRWVAGRPLSPGGATARIRYNMPDQPGSLRYDPRPDSDTLCFTFDHPVRAVAPGQSLVCYAGDRVLGGGFITRSDGYSDDEAGSKPGR